MAILSVRGRERSSTARKIGGADFGDNFAQLLGNVNEKRLGLENGRIDFRHRKQAALGFDLKRIAVGN